MSATLTLFDAQKRLTKRMTKVGGQISKESAALSRAKAQRVEVANARELAHLLDNLESTQALAYGVTERLSAAIGPRDYLGPGEIPRSRESFSWPQGAGVLFLDLDGKHDTDDVPRLREILATAMPELADAPQVWTRSASGGIRDTETGEVHQGGLHAYMLVADAAAIPRIGRQVYDALWLAGWGYYMLSAAASVLDRCLIDEAVFQPERLDYAAAPELGEGLERVGGTVVAVHNDDAEPLNPARIAPMSDNEMARLAAVKRDARMAIKPDMERERRVVLDSLPPEKRESRRLQYLAADRSELCGDAVLHFSDGSTACASDILGNVSTYAGKRLADPLEPGYAGGDNRIAMVTDSGAIYSHAHGGRLFRIVEAPQEAPEGVVALDPEPDTRDIVAACYRLRAFSKGDGLNAVCEATGATQECAERVFLQHLKEKALPLHRAGTAKRVGTFGDARGEISKGDSTLILAALGSGKTEKIGRHVMQSTNRATSVTVLRALVESHTGAFGSVHYSEANCVLGSAPRISSTVHSLNKMPIDGYGVGDVVLLDEFAAIASLLYETADNRILSAAKQAQVLDTLRDLRSRGVQFVGLDGDMTPTAAQLASELGMRCISVDEQPYAPPRVELVAHEEQGLPDHGRILDLLNKGERVVIATDSKDRAETWGHELAAYKPLVIHGDNSDCEAQAAFLADPQALAPQHNLVIYSPAVGVGVSVTSVSAHIFVYQHSGTTGADGMWQSARRYRIAGGGVIRWHVSQNLCRPQRAGLSRTSIQIDVTNHASALGGIDKTIPGVIASHWQRAVFDANPLYATLGHLANIGLDVSINTMCKAESKDEAKLARDAVKLAKVERVADAGPVEEGETLKRTPDDQARGARQHLEQALCLTRDDYLPDGSLPRETVRRVLEDRLVSRVERLASVHARSMGVDLDLKGTPQGFAYQSHRNRQTDIMIDIICDLKDEQGRLVVNAERARSIANQYRASIHVVYGDISKPQAKGSNTQYSRWLRDLLNGWGYHCEESVAINGYRSYHYRPDPAVVMHIGKVVKRMRGESGCTLNALQAAS